MNGIITPALAFVVMMATTYVVIAISAIIQIRVQNTLQERWDDRDEFRVVYWITDEILMVALTILIMGVHLVLLQKLYQPMIQEGIVWAFVHYAGVFLIVLVGFRPNLIKISSHAIQCRNENPEAQTPLTISCIIGITMLIVYAALWGDASLPI